MPILVTCDCGKRLSAPDAAAGKFVRCPGCGLALRMPESSLAATVLDSGGGETQFEGSACKATGGSDALGRYPVVGTLGRGGMGEVLLVRDPDLGRELAAKVVLTSRNTGELRRAQKFLAEARITGQLEHPNIVPVHELGKCPDGRRYFTMKHVRGRDLAAILADLSRRPGRSTTHSRRRERASARLRRHAGEEHSLGRLLQIFLKVCDAIAFAHSRGVIHRDLKPANIMVGEFGEVLVMDWGIAKVLGAPDPEAGAVVPEPESSAVPQGTIEGALIGTPAYMSPEQARGEIERIDARSDIYSLGAILYEILALAPPFAGPGPMAVVDKVAAGDLVPPSRRSPARAVPRELEAAVLRAMALDPRERYQRAEGLRTDIEAFLTGHTLAAARYTPAQRFGKWIGRHRGAAAVAAAAALVLVTVSTGFVLRLDERRRDAERSAERADAAARAADAARLSETAARGLAESKEREARLRYGDALEEKGLLLLERRSSNAAAVALAAALGIEDQTDRRTSAVGALAGSWLSKTLAGHTSLLRDVEWAPDGSRLATASRDGTVRLWDSATGACLATLPSGGESVSDVAWSPSSGVLAAAVRGRPIQLWNAGTGEKLIDLVGQAYTDRVEWCPGPKLLASQGRDTLGPENRTVDTVYVWDPVAGKSLLALGRDGTAAAGFAWRPDGGVIAVGYADGTARILDPRTGVENARMSAAERAIHLVAWSPDATRLAGASGREAWIWDAANESAIVRMTGHTDGVTGLAWSAGGGELVTSSFDRTARIWDARTGAGVAVLQGHTEPVLSVAVSADGRIATSSSDGSVRVWEGGSHDSLATLDGHVTEVVRVAWSPDGGSLATASTDGTARVWSATGNPLWTPASGGSGPVAWSPDGARVLASGTENAARIWDAGTGAVLATLSGHAGQVRSVAWSRDGARAVTASEDRTLRLWDASTGSAIAQMTGHRAHIYCIAPSPDGSLLASAAADGLVLVWDGSSGRFLYYLAGHTSHVLALAWSPDGTRLASLGAEKTVRIWDIGSRACLATLPEEATSLSGFAWSPDGERLATVCYGFVARIWNGRTGELLATLEGRETPEKRKVISGGWTVSDAARTIAWSPDGARLACAYYDETVWLWDSRGGEPIRVLDAHTARVSVVLWSPDGSILATAPLQESGILLAGGPMRDTDTSVWLWEGRTGAPLAALPGGHATLTGVAWSPDSTRLATTSANGAVRVWDAALALAPASRLREIAEARTDLALEGARVVSRTPPAAGR